MSAVRTLNKRQVNSDGKTTEFTKGRLGKSFRQSGNSPLKKIFHYQIWHLVTVAVLFVVLHKFITLNKSSMNGMLWGFSAITWFWLATAVPVIHQLYAWLIWRLELFTVYSHHASACRKPL